MTQPRNVLWFAAFAAVLLLPAGNSSAQTVSATLPAGTAPQSVAVNPVSNQIYVANGGSNTVTVIDGATNATTTVAAGTVPRSVAVNPVTNQIYVANDGSNNVTVIDGATNATSTVAPGTSPFSVAVNPVTNKIYVANGNSANVTLLTEQQVQMIPLTTTITPLPNNQTTNPTPTFTFTASSSFSPTTPPPGAVYFQLDTWQGAWTPASSTGTPGSFSAALPTLSLGIHILYAYATDGQDASSIQTGGNGFGQSSPVIGNIAAYLFLVVPLPTDFSLSPVSAITVSVGGFASTTVTVDSINGFSSPVTLSVSGAPAGVTPTFSQSSVTPPGSSQLNLSLTPAATPSTFTLTITGTSGSLTHSTTASVTANADSSSITNVIGQLLSFNCVDSSGIGNALTKKLSAAQAFISAGAFQDAINTLTALISQLQAQSGKHISVSCTINGASFNSVTALITDVQSLIDSLRVSALGNPITGYVVDSTGVGVADATVSILDASGSTVIATATTDITGFDYMATTGVLISVAGYSLAVTGLPAGFMSVSPANQPFMWQGTAVVFANFVLN